MLDIQILSQGRPLEASYLTLDVLIALFQSSEDCNKLLDSDGRILVMNVGGAAAMDLEGPSALVGQHWPDFWNGPDRDAALTAIERARLGHAGRFQAFLPTAKGVAKWWDSVVTPIAIEGRDCRFLVVSRDITERRQLHVALQTAVRRTKAIISASAPMIWHSDPVQGAGFAHGWAQFTGDNSLSSQHESWLRSIHPDDAASVHRVRHQGMAAGAGYSNTYRLRHHSGDWRWVEDRAVPLLDDGGAVTGWVGTLMDIHDRVLAERNLRASEERLRLALEASRLGTWDVNLVTGERQWSNELKDILGLPHSVKETEAVLFERIIEDDRALIERTHRTTFLQTTGFPSVTFRIRRADTGELRWLLSRGRAVVDEEGRLVRRIGTMQDITEQHLAEERLWLAANRDALTGLTNRNLFHQKLDQALLEAEDGGMRVGLLLIDLDHFKDVNDTVGHDAGDKVLRAMAERLACLDIPASTVARLGGDEFAILTTEVGTLIDFNARAQAFVETMNAPVAYGDTVLNCSVSVGLAIYPDHDRDKAELLKNADIALYAAKRAGRGRHAVFEPAMKLEIRRRVTVLQRARDALANLAICPFYQPKIDVGTMECVGFEALLRFRDASGLQPPGAIQEALDDPELSAQIGQRMLNLVIADLQRWSRDGLRIGSVAVNVSAAEFHRVDVAARWLRRLEETAVLPEMLHIEVTETVFLDSSSEAVSRSLRCLHERGIGIALDDFGTGYASLKHLRDFPVDWLKIDRSFIADLDRNAGADAIVSAIIGLAHGMGLGVVAEGVETERQAQILRAKGCDVIQGYWIAKPMPASRIPHFLETWPELAGVAAPTEARRRARL